MIEDSETSLPFQQDLMIHRDRPLELLVNQLLSCEEMPLVTISGPSGVGKSDLAGPLLRRKLGAMSNQMPTLACIKAESDDDPLDLISSIGDLIVQHHPEFETRRQADVFREKVKRWIRNDPQEAAVRIVRMLEPSEQGNYDASDIKLILCLDGIDKLFASSREQHQAIEDWFFFVLHLAGLKSILITLVYRSWVASEVEAILGAYEKAGLRRLAVEVPYPAKEEAVVIVDRMIATAFQGHNVISTSTLSGLENSIRQSAKENPQGIGLIPVVLGQIDEGKIQTVEETARDLFESCFRRQPQRVRQVLSGMREKMETEGAYSLDYEGESFAEHLEAGLQLVELRVLSIDGSSPENIVFHSSCHSLGHPNAPRSIFQQPSSLVGKALSVAAVLTLAVLAWSQVRHPFENQHPSFPPMPDLAAAIPSNPSPPPSDGIDSGEGLSPFSASESDSSALLAVPQSSSIAFPLTAEPKATDEILLVTNGGLAVEKDKDRFDVLAPAESLPAESLPAESLPAESLPAESLPEEKEALLTNPAEELSSPEDEPALAAPVPITDEPATQSEPILAHSELKANSPLVLASTLPHSISSVGTMNRNENLLLAANCSEPVLSPTPLAQPVAVPTETSGPHRQVLAEHELFKSGILANPEAPAEYKELIHGADRLDTATDLYFVSNGVGLTPESTVSFEKLVAFLDQPESREFQVILIGFADNVGTMRNNLKVSKRRAEAVAQWLQEKAKVSVYAEGFGEALPAAPNDSPESRAANRRVEVWIHR